MKIIFYKCGWNDEDHFYHLQSSLLLACKQINLLMMETITHSNLRVHTHQKKTTKSNTQRSFWKMLEFNRFGVIAWTLSIVGCFSGIVAGLFVDGSNQLQLTLVIAPTMLTLCMILAVAPIRVILAVGAATVLIDLLMMLFGLF